LTIVRLQSPLLVTISQKSHCRLFVRTKEGNCASALHQQKTRPEQTAECPCLATGCKQA
ncbi:hypothetical protein EG68_12155, partial [Paragonimus skrjabini miyazakii]